MTKRKRRTPTLKEQVFKIGRGVAKILAVLPALETKEESQKRFFEVDQRFTRLGHEIRAAKEELKEELKVEIKAVVDHAHKLFERHNESHRRLDAKLNDHESRLSAVESKT